MLRAALIIGILVSSLMVISPRLASYATLSVFGYRLSWLLGFLPPMLPFLVLCLVALELRTIRLQIIVSALVTALVAYVSIPFILNRQVDQRAREFMEADRLDFKRPAKLGVLALRSRADLRCDELCQRLLLNRQVQRLLYVPVYDMGAPLDTTMSAQSFRLERRGKCPHVDLAPTFGEFIVASDVVSGVKLRPADQMKQAMAGGLCLIVENAVIHQADVIVSRGSVNAPNPQASRSFISGYDKVHAERLTVHVREGDNFVETYRSTSVSGERLSPLVFATLNFGQLDARKILRYSTRTYHEGPPWSVFVTEFLGLDVSLPRS